MASSRALVHWLFAIMAACIMPLVLAQTWTDCNPMEKDDCPAHPALGRSYTVNLDAPLDGAMWKTTAGKVEPDKDGGKFSVNGRLTSTTIQSQFYIFFGRLEVVMKAAPGRGIVSSIVIQSETLDEIDFEWVGTEPSHVQTNYFGKGNTTTYDRSGKHLVDDAINKYHTYTIDWNKDRLQFLVDGNLARTVHYRDALGGRNYPQTPSNVRLGIWPGGDPGNAPGTIEWAGGEVDYDAGPYHMTVKQLTVQDFSSGKQYMYGDRSGSWESIRVIGGESAKLDDSWDEPNEPDEPDDGSPQTKEAQYEPEVVHERQREASSRRWEDLPKSAQIGIPTSTAIVTALGLGIFAFCCIRQRRAGRNEYNAESSKLEEQQNGAAAFRSQLSRGYRAVR